MKRPELKPRCKGCDELHSRDCIIEGGQEAYGVCNGCKESVLFDYVGNGKYQPQPHPPQKPRRSGGLTGQRRLGRR
jgi:hypothetical protein